MADEAKDDKPFLSRWSERKRAVQAEEAAREKAPEPDERDVSRAEAEEAEREANRTAAEAIDLEALTDASDYAPFFRAGVPLALKNAALRKLWRSNPVFAVLDGLNDHDLDYRWPEKGSEVVKTAWKVGRGFLTGEGEGKAEAERADKPAADSASRSAVTEEEPVEANADEPVSEAEAPAAAEPDEAGPVEEAEPVKVSLSRRLDFAAFAKGGDER